MVISLLYLLRPKTFPFIYKSLPSHIHLPHNLPAIRVILLYDIHRTWPLLIWAISTSSLDLWSSFQLTSIFTHSQSNPLKTWYCCAHGLVSSPQNPLMVPYLTQSNPNSISKLQRPQLQHFSLLFVHSPSLTWLQPLWSLCCPLYQACFHSRSSALTTVPSAQTVLP